MDHVTKVTVAIKNTVRLVREKRVGYQDNYVSNGKCQKWRDVSPNPEEQRKLFTSFNEYKFLICLICFSSTIVFIKVLSAYKDAFQRIFTLGKMEWSKPLNLSKYYFISIPSAVFYAVWNVIVAFNWLLIPAILGIITTLITWRMVYWNSRIPGVDPPSPFSPRTEGRIQLSTIFSCSNGYVFALFAGIFVFLGFLASEILFSSIPN